MFFRTIHHVAIIVSDYERSKRFYTEVLGLRQIAETNREEKNDTKLDLQLGDFQQIEMFASPNPPPRVTNPEACGLRHLAFGLRGYEMTDAREHLLSQGVEVEAVRVDPTTGKKFFFFRDPDGLPLEVYEL